MVNDIRENPTVKKIQEYSVPLIVGVLIALLWANLAPESYDHFIHFSFIGDVTVHFLVQDVFMIFFFAIAAVEIVESFQTGGALNPVKKAITPLIATLGGIFGPIMCYLLLNHIFGSPEFTKGWGIPTATDIAIAWLVGRMVFGEGHPAIKFLLLLAVADDAIGLVIIAIFYPDPTMPVEPMWLIFVVIGMLVAAVLKKLHINNYWPYIIAGGSLSWFGMHMANIHPSLALVVIVPFLPKGKFALHQRFFYAEPEEYKSPLPHFEHDWKIVVDFGLFFFGLVNAGVAFSAIGMPTYLVLSSLIIGKIVGIFVFGYVGAVLLRFGFPEGMSKRDLLVAATVAAIGLTVALFMSASAFVDPEIQGAAKMGALFSVISAPLAIIIGKLTRVRKMNAIPKK